MLRISRKKNTKMTLLAWLLILSSGLVEAKAFWDIVFDPTNHAENAITATNAIETAKNSAYLIKQYETQLEQYKNMIQNTNNPAEQQQIWAQAQDTINKLIAENEKLENYKKQNGYLDNFQDETYYSNSPCFTEQGCSAAEYEKLKNSRVIASEAQKKANDALVKGLDQQQTNLKKDAETLQTLQANAKTADGQVKALTYANQLAAQQNNQLMQIRAMMIAEQNANAARRQALADKEAKEAAADEAFRKGKFKPSSGQKW